MKKPSRLFQIVFVVLALFVASAGFAPKAEAKLFDFLFKNDSLEKNIEAKIESFDSGTTSNPVLVGNFFENIQVEGLLAAAGAPSEDSPAMKDLTESEKAVIYEKYGKGGAIGDVGSAIAMMYHPPASARTYVADILQSAHIVPKAQAQGLGFASLDPILETWKIFRNVAYLFFVVIFLVIGFMIMFRKKINGQTVVTAQQAIPKIVVSLIAVTFSYAIAGFLIDLMYILMFLMIGVFQPAAGTGILSKNFLELGVTLITGDNGLNSGAFETMNEAVQGFAKSIIVSETDKGGILGVLGGLTLALIVSIAVLIGVFKLFFELLKTYITIIILIATAPLSLMTNALPGSSNFGNWVKNVFGNLLAFPVVLFALILYEMFTSSGLEVGGFVPPFMIGSQQGSGSVIMALVGIGIILIIPDLIKQMKKALKVDEGIWGTLAGAAVKQFQEGAPLGATIAGAGTGLLTAPGSFAKAAWDNRKMPGGTAKERRLKRNEILRNTLSGRYGLANNAARSSSLFSKGAVAAGGKTPSSIKFIEDAAVKGSQYLSEDEHVKRVEGGGGMWKKPIDSSMSYDKKIEWAEKTAKKSQHERQRLKDEKFGQEVD